MKHLTILLAAFCSALFLSSCDKAYTCRCESTGGWGPGPVFVDIKAHDENAAKVECIGLYRGYNDAPSDCHLK